MRKIIIILFIVSALLTGCIPNEDTTAYKSTGTEERI